MNTLKLIPLVCALLNAACIPGIINRCSYALSDEFVLTTNDPEACNLANGIQVSLLHPHEKGMAPSADPAAMDSSQIFFYECLDLELFDSYWLNGVPYIDFHQPAKGYKWWKSRNKEEFDTFTWEILPDRWYRIDGLQEGGASIVTLFFMKTKNGVVTEKLVRVNNY
ncbi:MAG: hypothetical protein JNJ91_02870 [Flavobacteriales bacterium]|nr:hypothetical protein [Flavobacteriales bacterium]